MRMRNLVGAIALAALVAIPAQAWPGGGRKCKGPDGEKPHRMWQKMNLSDEQKTQLKDMHKEMEQARKSHMGKVKDLRDKMREELSQETPDRAKLDSYAQQLGTLHQEMTNERIDHLLQLKKVLTPEQFQMLLDREEHGPRMGPGGKCPRGGKGMHKGCPRREGPEGPGPEVN